MDGAGAVGKPWLQRVDQELFPFKDLVNQQINAFAMRYTSSISTNSRWPVGYDGLNAWLGAATDGLDATARSMIKRACAGKLSRSTSTCVISRRASSRRSWGISNHWRTCCAIPRPIRAAGAGAVWMARPCLNLPPDPGGYADFVADVEISKSIQFMND